MIVRVTILLLAFVLGFAVDAVTRYAARHLIPDVDPQPTARVVIRC